MRRLLLLLPGLIPGLTPGLILCAVLGGATLLGVIPRQARAYNLNLFGGSSIHSNEYGLAAVELTLPLIAEIGPFFDWSHTTETGPENRYIAGLMGRITTPWLNFFVDTRAGYHWDSGFNLEFGAGYRFVGDTIDILPRFGFNAVGPGGGIPDFNLSVGAAIVL